MASLPISLGNWLYSAVFRAFIPDISLFKTRNFCKDVSLRPCMTGSRAKRLSQVNSRNTHSSMHSILSTIAGRTNCDGSPPFSMCSNLAPLCDSEGKPNFVSMSIVDCVMQRMLAAVKKVISGCNLCNFAKKRSSAFVRP